MKCPSCQEDLNARTTKLFRKKVIVCSRCCEVAEKQAKELEAASARALEQSMLWLEQRVLSGALLGGTTPEERKPEGG